MRSLRRKRGLPKKNKYKREGRGIGALLFCGENKDLTCSGDPKAGRLRFFIAGHV